MTSKAAACPYEKNIIDQCVPSDDLRPLWEKLAAYRSRMRLVLPNLAAAHPEVMLLASVFKHYHG